MAPDAVAKNEALFRHVNIRIEELHEHTDATDEIDFLCECAIGACLEPMCMRRDEFELLRSNATHFAVVPGHERPDVERVIAANERFLVIEKLPGEQQVARLTDPRV